MASVAGTEKHETNHPKTKHPKDIQLTNMFRHESTASVSSSYDLNEDEVDQLMDTMDAIDEVIVNKQESDQDENDEKIEIQQRTSTVSAVTINRNNGEEHSESKSNDYVQKDGIQSNQNMANNTSTTNINQNLDIIKRLDTKIEVDLIWSGHFWIRIFILILTIILIMLSISYAFGAMSSIELSLINSCPDYTKEEVWHHSLQENITNPTHPEADCYIMSSEAMDLSKAFDKNTYQYVPIGEDKFMIAMVQCVIFAVFALYCICIFVYGLYSLINDLLAMKRKNLYQYAPRFKQYINNNNDIIQQQQKQQDPVVINGCITRWKHRYDKYFGTDSNGYIIKVLLIEILEILLQTDALLYYNGYNVWKPHQVTLANSAKLIYLFVSVLSFNCMITGILWLSYSIKYDKCSGLLFDLSLFCVDQISDLFYALFPFFLVFGTETFDFTETDIDGNPISPIWVIFGLLNNNIYSVFPMLLLCSKCLLMTRKAIHSMRNKSFDIWLLVNKLMDTKTNHDALCVTATNMEDAISNKANNNNNDIDDEIFDQNGNVKVKVITSKTKKCKILIAIIAMSLMIYSIIILSLVINHLTKSQDYCMNAISDLNIIQQHPELYVYATNCNYTVYPFVFDADDISDNCECREFSISWHEINISQPHLDRNITPSSIIDNVLRKWTMMEKFYTSGTIQNSNDKNIDLNKNTPPNRRRLQQFGDPSGFSFNFTSSHFGATQMKLFWWWDIDILSIDDAISNWKELQLIMMKAVDQLSSSSNNSTLFPSTFSQLTNLRIFNLMDTNAFNIELTPFCNFPELQIILIRGEKYRVNIIETAIPHCFTTNLHKLSSLSLQISNIKAFPLELLNNSNLQQLDLSQNNITYHDLLNYGDNSNAMMNDTSFHVSIHDDLELISLNNNPICEYIQNEQFQEWAQQNKACYYKDCTNDIPICSRSWIGNGICEPLCDKKECYYDNGDCNQFCFTKTNCTFDQFINDRCDEVCNNTLCNYDAGRCNVTISHDMMEEQPGGKGTGPIAIISSTMLPLMNETMLPHVHGTGSIGPKSTTLPPLTQIPINGTGLPPMTSLGPDGKGPGGKGAGGSEHPPP